MKAAQRHKLKEDKFAQGVALAAAWARERQTSIVAVVLGILLAGGFAVWYAVSRQAAEETAQLLLLEARQSARIALYETEKQADAVREVVNRYERIVADYPNSEAAPLALLQAGQLLSSTGGIEKAAPYYERVLNVAADRPGLVLLARRGLAEALEESGKLREAIVHYRMLLEDAAAPVSAQVCWDMGRCHEQLEETQLASEFYRKAVDYDGDSTWAELARFRLAQLSSPPKPAPKGPAPEKPEPTAEPGEDKTDPEQAKPPAASSDEKPAGAPGAEKKQD